MSRRELCQGDALTIEMVLKITRKRFAFFFDFVIKNVILFCGTFIERVYMGFLSAWIRREDLERYNKLVKLEKRNEELVVEVMRQSARASEAEETLKRWRTELEIVAEQKGHNLCWIWIPSLLKATIGHTGKYPDPQKVTRAEFEFGCKVYQDDIFGSKIDIPKQLENQGMLTEEQAKLLREKLGFKE